MRTVGWFSAGAASAVAMKLAKPDVIVYCEVKEEHPDNRRFIEDCEKWFEQEVIIIGNDDYNRSIYEVFDKRRYISGIGGAPCTVLLKKELREKFQKPDDIHIFGYTVEEQDRLDRFIDANNEIDIRAPLIEEGLDKFDCLGILSDEAIDLPAMYKLGYKNNNCIGCCKGGIGYWLKIKQDFPEIFEKMNSYEKKLGVKLLKYTKDGEEHRIRLDQIPKHIKPMDDSLDIQCGIFCELAKDKL